MRSKGSVKTERLHYDDPLRLRASAVVVAHAEHGGAPSIVLDRTIFYPESGGQMGDHGTLGAVGQTPLRVIDTQLDAEGRVHHVVEGGPLPAVGTTLEAEVDEARRREHMALHTGQHALSRALLDELGAVTVSSRLGASACTIDVDRDGLDLDAVRRAEDRVNALIDLDRPVTQFFPSDRELEQMSLRKPPPDTDRVRVVRIEGFDVTPCGGTHAVRTSQIELLWIYGVERYKGGTRISFAAGPRARRLLRAESDLLRATARELKCAPPEIGGIVEGLKGKLDEAREQIGAWRARVADAWAARLASEQGEIVASVDGGDAALLRAIADRLAVGSTLVALCAPHDDGTDVLIARGPDATVACGELLRRVAAASGGRGGGRPDHAQGRLPAGIDWEGLVRGAL